MNQLLALPLTRAPSEPDRRPAPLSRPVASRRWQINLSQSRRLSALSPGPLFLRLGAKVLIAPHKQTYASAGLSKQGWGWLMVTKELTLQFKALAKSWLVSSQIVPSSAQSSELSRPIDLSSSFGTSGRLFSQRAAEVVVAAQVPAG